MKNGKPLFGSLLAPNQYSKGLVGYWPFRKAGNLVDFSHYGNDGVITGAEWQGGALDFTDDDVNIGATVYDTVTTEMTLIFRFRNDGSGAASPRLIDKFPGPSIYINQSTSELAFFGTIGGVTRDLRWRDADIVNGVWYTAAVRLGSGFQEAYIDGILVDTEIEGGPFAGVYSTGPGVDAVIGNRASDLDRDFDGAISDTKIYNRALSASEIQALSQNPNLPIYQPGTSIIYGGITPTGIKRRLVDGIIDCGLVGGGLVA